MLRSCEPLEELLQMQQEDFYQLYKLAGDKEVEFGCWIRHYAILALGRKFRRFQSCKIHLAPKWNEPIHWRVKPNAWSSWWSLARRLDIYQMQVSVLSALIRHVMRGLKYPHLIPLTDSKSEMAWVRELVVNQIDTMMADLKSWLDYTVGTMMPLPALLLTKLLKVWFL